MTSQEIKHQIAQQVEDAINAAIGIYESPLGIGHPEIIGLAIDAADKIAPLLHAQVEPHDTPQ